MSSFLDAENGKVLPFLDSMERYCLSLTLSNAFATLCLVSWSLLRESLHHYMTIFQMVAISYVFHFQQA